MTDAWFAPEISRWLAFLSLLSLLSIPAEQGRFRSAVTTIWIMAIVGAGALLVGGTAAYFLQQPSHVVRTLFVLGAIFGVAFGSTFPALRRGYREVELRKMTAADM